MNPQRDNQFLAPDMSKASADLEERFGGCADICDRMQAAVKQAVDDVCNAMENDCSGSVQLKLEDSMTDRITDALGF